MLVNFSNLTNIKKTPLSRGFCLIDFRLDFELVEQHGEGHALHKYL